MNENELKCNIEVAVSDASKKSGIYTDSTFRDDVKFACQSFLNKCKQVCSTRYNTSIHKTLKALSTDKSIKVCKFDKGVGVCVMNSEDYYTKLDTIVSDCTKFVELDMLDDNKPPWCVLESRVQYYCNTYLKKTFQGQLTRVSYYTASGLWPWKVVWLSQGAQKWYSCSPCEFNDWFTNL